MNYQFHSSLKKSIYLAIIQYRSLFSIFLPILIIFSSKPLEILDILSIASLCLCLVGYPAYDIHTRGLIKINSLGLKGYSFRQLGSSNHFLTWNEIELVEPYRYFGLRFLLLRYYSSATPLWLPLFLNCQPKLNSLILEYTTEDNPLHLALLKKGLFSQVQWHSSIQQYRSDRYILESAYTEKIYNSFKKYCLNLLPGLLPLCLLNSFMFNFDYAYTAITVSFYVFFGLFMWFFGVRSSYLVIKDEGIEMNLKFMGNHNRSFISWIAIERIEYSGSGLFKKMLVFLKEPVDGIDLVSFSVHSLDFLSLRRVVMNQTDLDNPLQQALIKY